MVGNGCGAARLNLLFEKRNYAAVAAQNIAEAHRHKLCFGALVVGSIIISHIRLLAPIMLVGFTALSVEISANFFAPYLSAHCAVFERSENVVFNSPLVGVVLHKRNVLMRRRMVHNIGAVGLRNTLSGACCPRTEPIRRYKVKLGVFAP